MQTDMHYYGTYAMARTAGVRDDIARAIATAAEYVDDSDRLDVVCKDGFAIKAEPTAHHPVNLANILPDDQRRTWVPFHFIPGNNGPTPEEKLVCVTDSAIARATVEHNLNNVGQPFGIMLLGITAHAYADTFSHYGFSGISSRVNKVRAPSIKFTGTNQAIAQGLSAKWDQFCNKYIAGPAANHLAQLGHGSVATYPDQPFLKWEFMYDDPERPSGIRENPVTFLMACRSLYEMFVDARKRFNGDLDDLTAFREFDDIAVSVREVLAVQGEAPSRINAWQRAVTDGRIFGNPGKQPIPVYDPAMFTHDLKSLSDYEREFAVRTLVYNFLQAADFHRNHVLQDLLPRSGIKIEEAPLEWLVH